MNEIADSKGRSLAMGKAYEEKHVHKVYQQIAQHFSSTRYKACNNCCLRKKTPTQFSLNIGILQPWPIVERFLGKLEPGSVGLDIGCGNGKYLAVNPNIFIVASDR